MIKVSTSCLQVFTDPSVCSAVQIKGKHFKTSAVSQNMLSQEQMRQYIEQRQPAAYSAVVLPQIRAAVTTLLSSVDDLVYKPEGSRAFEWLGLDFMISREPLQTMLMEVNMVTEHHLIMTALAAVPHTLCHLPGPNHAAQQQHHLRPPPSLWML